MSTAAGVAVPPLPGVGNCPGAAWRGLSRTEDVIVAADIGDIGKDRAPGVTPDTEEKPLSLSGLPIMTPPPAVLAHSGLPCANGIELAPAGGPS